MCSCLWIRPFLSTADPGRNMQQSTPEWPRRARPHPEPSDHRSLRATVEMLLSKGSQDAPPPTTPADALPHRFGSGSREWRIGSVALTKQLTGNCMPFAPGSLSRPMSTATNMASPHNDDITLPASYACSSFVLLILATVMNPHLWNLIQLFKATAPQRAQRHGSRSRTREASPGASRSGIRNQFRYQCAPCGNTMDACFEVQRHASRGQP